MRMSWEGRKLTLFMKLYRGISVSLASRLSFSSQSAKNKVLSIESTLHNKLSLKISTRSVPNNLGATTLLKFEIYKDVWDH